MKFYERVISDFGGYEKCKDILSQPNIDFIMNAQGLREHMLEYRRQHNIFEVGDDVFRENLDGVIRVINVYEDRLVIDTGIKTTPDSRNTMVMALPANMFRHATDAEIKAGKRLEVNDGS